MTDNCHMYICTICHVYYHYCSTLILKFNHVEHHMTLPNPFSSCFIIVLVKATQKDDIRQLSTMKTILHKSLFMWFLVMLCTVGRAFIMGSIIVAPGFQWSICFSQIFSEALVVIHLLLPYNVFYWWIPMYGYNNFQREKMCSYNARMAII